MNLQSQLRTLKDESRDLTRSQQAELSCQLAKQFEKVGEYEAAHEALREFSLKGEGLSNLAGLDDAAKAEVLLRLGTLKGYLGSSRQDSGNQETAKDLITRSIELFAGLGQVARVAEARGDLALCYWREGAFDEARATLESALISLGSDDYALKAVLLIRAGIVEMDSQRLNEALRFYNEAAPLVEQSESDALKGSFHMEFALLFRRLAVAENRQTYIDQALIENAAASFYHERAGNQRYLARVENNLGFLFFTIGRYEDAHQHLNRAHHLFLELKDVGTAAQVDDTRAQTLLGEGRIREAERLIRAAVRTLERGDEQAVLAEALTTYGTVMGRLGRYARAKELLNRAISIAETVGDLEGAGRAKLSIIEELSKQTPPMDMASTFEAAAELLQQSQDPTTSKRLIACARKVIAALGVGEVPEEASLPLEDSFSLRNEVRGKEKALIEKALRDAGGSVTKAAHLLGFKHHQSLISLINSRHPDLLNVRSAVRRRRRHLFSKSKKLRRRVPPAPPAPRRSRSQVSIFHAEDNKLVGQLVHDLVTAENWKIDLCTDGDTALKKLTGDEHYDVLVVDHDLPGLSGVELIQRARKITHRRRTPIIMLSGDDDYESEAWRAGADAFLKKPEEISDLPTTITRLLRERSSER